MDLAAEVGVIMTGMSTDVRPISIERSVGARCPVANQKAAAYHSHEVLIPRPPTQQFFHCSPTLSVIVLQS